MLCNSVYCNASSLLNACDNNSNISDDLFNDIKSFIDNDKFLSNSNDSELSSNKSINKYNFIDIDNINWKNNYNNDRLISEDNTNNKIHKINNNIIITKTNELIKFCPAFEDEIETIENVLDIINKNCIKDIDISKDLRIIIAYHKLLINISNYYAYRNKNRISNDFKIIANKFIKKSQDFYYDINKLINKKEHVEFSKKHKEILEDLSGFINNEHDFLK